MNEYGSVYRKALINHEAKKFITLNQINGIEYLAKINSLSGYANLDTRVITELFMIANETLNEQ